MRNICEPAAPLIRCSVRFKTGFWLGQLRTFTDIKLYLGYLLWNIIVLKRKAPSVVAHTLEQAPLCIWLHLSFPTAAEKHPDKTCFTGMVLTSCTEGPVV